jgi:hypothetical protein
VEMVEWVPELEVMVTLPVAMVADALLSELEYQDAVVARLFTCTECVPAVDPDAAVAVTALLLDVAVRAASGPVRLFSELRSFSTVWVAVCIALMALVSFPKVVSLDVQMSSGWRAAAIAAFTAAVTSRAAVLPLVAARMELISMPLLLEELEVELELLRSELREEPELIALPALREGVGRANTGAGDF